MYCPNCATKASSNQRFCRSCGLNLEVHAQMLTTQLAAGGFDTTSLEGSERRERRRKKLQRYSFFTTVAGLVLLSGVAIHWLLAMVLGHWDPVAEMITNSMFAGGLLMFLVGYWAYLSLPKTSAERPSPPTRLPEAPATMKLLLERSPERVSSVTEHTTELFQDAALLPNPRETARNRHPQ